jgi:hypothetical protein
VVDSLSEAQRDVLVATALATEAELWRDIRGFVERDRQASARRGVLVEADPPADLLAALRTAAEPDIRCWADSLGATGETVLADYRRALGF